MNKKPEYHWEMRKALAAFAALAILFILLANQFAHPDRMPIVPLLYVAFLAFVLWRFVLPMGVGMSIDPARVARGGTVQVQLDIPRGARRVEVGIRAEETYERTGKGGIICKETVHEELRPLPTGSRGKRVVSFEIPKNAPPSIGPYGGFLGYEKVRLDWYIFADADIPNASDMHSKAELKVE